MARLTDKQRERFAKARNRRKKLAEEFQSLTPEERVRYLPNPKEPPTEFEIQAFLYEQLQAIGFHVRGELKTRCGTCRFDLLVYSQPDLKPVRLIEIKKHYWPRGSTKTDKRRAGKERRKQVDRYSQFGVPVDLVCTLKVAREYLEHVKLNGFPLETWSPYK